MLRGKRLPASAQAAPSRVDRREEKELGLHLKRNKGKLIVVKVFGGPKRGACENQRQKPSCLLRRGMWRSGYFKVKKGSEKQLSHTCGIPK